MQCRPVSEDLSVFRRKACSIVDIVPYIIFTLRLRINALDNSVLVNHKVSSGFLYGFHGALVLPVVSAFPADAHGAVCGMHLFFGDGSGGRSGSVLASFEKLDDQARDECDAPDEEIDQPPPPTDEEPPEAAMPPLRHGSCFCFGLCGSSPGFLEELHVYVLTAAFRTSHDATSVNRRAGHPQSRGAMQALYGCRCVLFLCSIHSFFSLCAVIAGGAVLLRSASHPQ